MKNFFTKTKVFFLICGMILSFLCESSISYAEEKTTEDELQLYAQSAVLMDAVSGRILFEKNGQEIRPMASTTKIMTCILALEYGNLEDYVTVSSRAASMPKVKLGMREGECYRLEDLLYSLMLESHNDTAVAIAEHIGGSIPAFAEMMNQKAKELGCFRTYFVTPNGLDGEVIDQNGNAKSHSTTAEELAKIMSYCILQSPKKEEFLEITRTMERIVSGYKMKDETYVNNGRNFICRNHNAFLAMMDGALSGKTGFTGKAGYCYVGSLKQGDRIFTVALLGCGWPNNKNYKWKDTKKLMEYGLANYTYHYLNEFQYPEEKLEKIHINHARTNAIGEQYFSEVEVLQGERKSEGLLLKENEEIKIKVDCIKEVEAPVYQGTSVGQICYLLNGQVLRKDRIVLVKDVLKIDYKWCLKQLIEMVYL